MRPIVRALAGLLLTTLVYAGPAAALNHPGPERAQVPAEAGRAQPAAQPAAQTAAQPAAAPQTWVKDRRRFTSPWFAGERRKMIEYGCTRAPFYDPDPRCAKRRGYHHGLDITMRCGTRLFSRFRGRVVAPDSAGALGPAYGEKAFRIRSRRHDVDVVIGHARRVYVEPGEVVRRGQLVARASDAAAPDGCHLHIEVRPKRGSHTDAVRPHRYLRLRPVE